jgi:hypothetical protein
MVWVGFSLYWVEPLAGLGAERGFHLVSAVKGRVWVLRGQQNPWPLGVGTDLRSTDKLKLDKNSEVRVLCPNLVSWNLKSMGTFVVDQGCRVTKRIVLKPTNEDRIPSRGSDDATRPYLLGPRDTKILEAQPLLRWNPVDGIQRYSVKVSGPGVEWTTEVSQSQVRYNGKEVLQPGIRYRVSIKGTKEGSLANDDITGFSLLDRATVAQVKAEISILQKEGINSEAKILELAHLERSYELYEAAIVRLNQWLSQGNQSAAVQQLLGDLYWQIKLPRLAEQYYRTAQKLMQQNKNTWGEAEALNRLGKLGWELGQIKAAIAYLEAAKPVYQELADLDQVRAIEARLADLRQRV